MTFVFAQTSPVTVSLFFRSIEVFENSAYWASGVIGGGWRATRTFRPRSKICFPVLPDDVSTKPVRVPVAKQSAVVFQVAALQRIHLTPYDPDGVCPVIGVASDPTAPVFDRSLISDTAQ